MKKLTAFAAALCLHGSMASIALADDAPEAPVLTDYQATRVKLCVGAADMGRAMAEMKAQGKTEQERMEYYTSRGVNDSLMRAISNDVTVSDTSRVWDYSVSLAGKCSQKIASVDAGGQRVASYCMQQYLRANVAAAFKLDNKPFTAVQEFFKDSLNGAGPRELTDFNEAIQAGYSLAGDKIAISNQVADKCVDRFTSH